MLFIDIKDAPKKLEETCCDVLNWYAEKFLKRYDFDVTVEHCKLKDYCGATYVSGSLEKCRDFTIEIDRTLKEEEYTKTLIHEMIHIEDYIKGNLTEDNGKRYWKGVEYLEYETQPWEARAADLEQEYYDQYCCTLF